MNTEQTEVGVPILLQNCSFCNYTKTSRYSVHIPITTLIPLSRLSQFHHSLMLRPTCGMLQTEFQ
jgi:hypothetical protein